MKILIFENEFSYVENAFNYVNVRYFDGKLQFVNYSKSQDLSPFREIEEFDHVFIDISLAKKSELDGFGILQKIKDKNLKVKKITVMTGNNNIEKKLDELGFGMYTVIIKPITFTRLKEVLTNK